MSAKPRMTWSADADQQLLVAIVNTLPSKALDYELVAQYFGKDLTAKAIEHRVRRLKAMFSSEGQTQKPPQQEAGSEPQNESPKKRKLA
ncbi:hypothetical protein PISL3812_06824 [Talaromyces islandicus]|uniref:Myb-like domain-containing protein n=1 Tax=Talaromyces islandicus TaxID=28573 RepID=A0A0U1M2H6_TALIS|nr:hypothetical protein PISL3812_06824 [Talaromyces islandicus]